MGAEKSGMLGASYQTMTTAREADVYKRQASAMTNNLERIALELQELIDKPSKIPLSLPDVSNNLTNLSTYATSLQEMPLALDYIEILPPGERAANPHATIWQQISVTLQNFLAAFQKDYNAVAAGETGAYSGKPLELWVSPAVSYTHLGLPAYRAS